MMRIKESIWKNLPLIKIWEVKKKTCFPHKSWYKLNLSIFSKNLRNRNKLWEVPHIVNYKKSFIQDPPKRIIIRSNRIQNSLKIIHQKWFSKKTMMELISKMSNQPPKYQSLKTPNLTSLPFVKNRRTLSISICQLVISMNYTPRIHKLR
jgi:hypothetical protein